MKTLVRGIYTFDILNFTPFKTDKTDKIKIFQEIYPPFF